MTRMLNLVISSTVDANIPILEHRQDQSSYIFWNVDFIIILSLKKIT